MKGIFLKNDIINIDNVKWIRKIESKKAIFFAFLDNVHSEYEFENYQVFAEKWVEICEILNAKNNLESPDKDSLGG